MNRASKEGIHYAPGISNPFNSHATRWLSGWIDSDGLLKEHLNTMMSKAYHAKVRVRSLQGMFGLSPANVHKIQVAAI
jgi:hypothetical protein